MARGEPQSPQASGHLGRIPIVAGDWQQRWQAGVQPPIYNAVRVANETTTSILRTIIGWHTLPSAQFFQPLASGWVGIGEAVVVVLCFVSFCRGITNSCGMQMSSSAVALSTDCTRRCNASTLTCLVCVEVFHVTAGRMARTMTNLCFTSRGGATPRVLGRQLPLPPPPPPRGLRPTVSCQRCRPQASMGA